MGIIVKPYTFAAGGTVVHTEWNACFDTPYVLINGNIDDANIKAGANINGNKLLNTSITASKLAGTAITDSKIDYTSVKVVRSGPNQTGTNGERMARGLYAFTLVAGVATSAIVFSTDATDGNPAFATNPVVTFGIQTAGVNLYSPKITALSSSGMTVEVRSSSGADVSTGTLHWHAEGSV